MTVIYRRCPRLATAACVMLLLAVGCGTAGEDSSPFDELRSEAERNPGSINPWLRLGDAHLQVALATADLRQTSLAESAIVRALGIDSTRFDALMQLSRIKSLQNRFREATKVQHRALFQNLRSSDAWAVHGDAFMALGNYRAADSCYHVMWELDQGFEARLRIANRELWLGERENAISEQQQAVLDGGGSGVAANRLADAHAGLAEMLLLYGEVSPAREHIAEALALNDANLFALELDAAIREYDGDWQGAVQTAERLTRLSSHPHYELVLARACRGAGEEARARRHADRARKKLDALAEEFPEATVRERITVLLERKPEAALRLAYEESRRRRDAGAYDLLAQAYLANGKTDEAWSAIAFALRRGVRHPRIVYRAAVVAAATGERKRFETYASRARELNPEIEKLFGPFEEKSNAQP